MAKSLLLDTARWDVVLDSSGNLAVCTEPYQIAQDVATAVRTFLTEVYYDTTFGVPYFEQVLGRLTPLSVIKSLILNVAKTVPGCNDPVLYITSFVNRTLSGQIQFHDQANELVVVQLSHTARPFALGVSGLGGPDYFGSPT